MIGKWLKLAIKHPATHWMVLLTFGLSSFFPWYFLENPEALPFSFDMSIIISQVMIMGISLPLWWGGYKLGGYMMLLQLAVLGIYSIIMEIFAIQTGWVYSAFEYGDIIGTTIAGVPWTVGLSWLPFFTFSLGIVMYIKRWQYRILWGTIFLVWCDVVLDPAATKMGFWSWELSEGFYNVPWHNFLGWIFSSAGAFALWELLPISMPYSQYTGRNTCMFSGLLSLAFWTGMNLWLGFWIPMLAGLILIIVGYTIGYTSSVGVRIS